MKNIKLTFLVLFSFVMLFSCTKVEDDVLTGGAKTGGLLSVTSGLVSYAVGNGNDFKYPVSFSVFQGAIKTSKVDVYKVFSTTIMDAENKPKVIYSNEALLKTIDVPSELQSNIINFDVTYNELTAGLTINGAALPTSDSQLQIGDAWTLKYVAHTSNGDQHLNAQTTKVSVGTRFAGTYKVIQGDYWRINTFRPDIVWLGGLRVIESVDATTYKFVDFAGPFEAVTNTHYFTIDGNDLVNTPVSYNGVAQLLNGLPVTNCLETPTNILNACGVTTLKNTVYRDNENGKDRIYRVYGYLAASGPREFYEVLEKVVN